MSPDLKKKFVILFTLFIQLVAFSQNDIFAIKVIWTPNERLLSKYTPSTGAVSTVSPSSIFDWYSNNGAATIDPENQVYYIKSSNNSYSQYSLIGIDIKTGEIISKAHLPNPDDLHQMVYNCRDSSLYGIKVIWSPNERYLVKVNPLTGVTTTISSSSIFDWYLDDGGATIDTKNGIYYIKTRDSNFGNNALIGIDLKSGDIVSNAPVINQDDIHQMQFNYKDNSIYAIKVIYNPNQRFLVKINPISGAVTQLSPNPIFPWYSDNGGSAINPRKNTFNIKCKDSNGTMHWMQETDLTTGLPISKTTLNNPDDIHQMALNSNCNSSMDYIVQNTCIGQETTFLLDSCITEATWDFGEPISGNDNFSSLLKPIHIYKDTGQFQITAILNTCCKTDTIIKSIRITSGNQNTILPNDTLLCIGDSILLTPNNISPPFKWNDNSTQPTKLIKEEGIYWLTEETCNTTDSIIIQTIQTPILGFPNDTTLCLGKTLTINASSLGANYKWENNSTNPVRTITKGGLYWLKVNNTCGTGEDSILINYDSIPQINLGNDTTLCTNQFLKLDVEYPNSQYFWNNFSSESSIQVDKAGVYSVSVSNLCGVTWDKITVKYNELPELNLGNDSSICTGSSLVLNATNKNASYLWNDNDHDSIKTIQTSGLYTVKVSTHCGSITDSIRIEVDSLPDFKHLMDTALCEGQLLLLDATTGNSKYLWNDNSTEAIYSVYEPGTYSVQITNSCGQFKDSSKVSFLTTPILYLGNDTIVCEDKELTLDVTYPNSTYLWNDNSVSPIKNIITPGIYSVEVSNQCGVEFESINILHKNCEVILDLPNIFTPNGDGLNDIFTPININEINSLTITIYNRWGVIVYDSNNVQWDGNTNEGLKVAAGVYFFVINYTDVNGNKLIKNGSINLIR